MTTRRAEALIRARKNLNVPGQKPSVATMQGSHNTLLFSRQRCIQRVAPPPQVSRIVTPLPEFKKKMGKRRKFGGNGKTEGKIGKKWLIFLQISYININWGKSFFRSAPNCLHHPPPKKKPRSPHNLISEDTDTVMYILGDGGKLQPLCHGKGPWDLITLIIRHFRARILFVRP